MTQCRGFEIEDSQGVCELGLPSNSEWVGVDA